MNKEEVSERIHVLFFPFPAHGHMLPVLDMAKLFSSRGAKSTILTTPSNSKILENTIEAFKNQKKTDLDIGIKVFDFPCVDLGLPEGCDGVDFISTYKKPGGGDLLLKLFLSTKYMKQQLESFIETTKPSCLVADMFFPWATESAEKFGVPRLVFHGTSFFSLCCFYNMSTHKPHKTVATSSTPFVVTGLPGDIVMTAEQANVADDETPMGKIMREIGESESTSFGVVVNSFYELESAYADFYSTFVAKRVWHIGPLSLCNRDFAEKAGRGQKANIDEQECLRWLESKTYGSVIYVSFGSGNNFTNEQMLEIAAGLEGSGQCFIWVVGKKSENQGEKEEWLPEGYEERMKGKGLIIRGWAPQVLILDHKAVGGFVTHCGWNSAIEGISAGLPMVTWPKGAEQFYNEKLLTQVLRIGVNVGAAELVKKGKLISREEVEKAVREVMCGGEEAEERRMRAKKLGEMAKLAVCEGGSSYNDLDRLMEELNNIK